MEHEMLGLLGHLFAKPLCKADVLEHLRTSPAITPEARQLALTLIERYREDSDPERYHQASWAVLRQPYLNAFQYRFALRQAETACRMAPENGQYRTSLGVAQYRVGRVQDALETLKRAEERHSGKPASLAFLAMTQQRLGLKDQARATLERLRQTMRDPELITDTDARMFVAEAEALLSAVPATNK
jgi:tetratricopeptide (TPR) repeat protein